MAGDTGGRRTDRRVWWALVVFISIWGGSYALGAPPRSGGDETMHVLKATTVARGQLTGEPHPFPVEQVIVYGPEMATFDVPLFLTDGNVECFRNKPDVVPTCYTYDGDPTFVTLWYPDNKYQPIFYALVGLPARLKPPGAASSYLMRLMTVLLVAMLLASSLLSVRHGVGRALVGLGLLVAVTPTLISASGTVSPSAAEIAAAAACWATALALAFDARAGTVRADGRLLLRFAVCASFLAVVRPASPGFLAVIVITAAAVAGWPACRALLAQRRVQIAAVPVALAVLFTAGWYVVVRPILVGTAAAPTMDGWDLTQGAIGKFGKLYIDTIGTFGVQDYQAPIPVVVIWTIMLGGLVALALLAARRRLLIIAAALIALFVLLPITVDLIQARTIGLNWSSMYTLPIAVGIPILLGFMVGERAAALPSTVRLRTAYGAFVALAQAACVWQLLRRFAVGQNGPLWFWTQTQWSAPVNNLVLLLAGCVGVGGFVGVVLWATAPQRHLGDVVPEAAPAAETDVGVSAGTGTETAAAVGTGVERPAVVDIDDVAADGEADHDVIELRTRATPVPPLTLDIVSRHLDEARRSLSSR